MEALILTKNSPIYLSVNIITLERWLVNYKTGGIVSMLTDMPKNQESKTTSVEIHKGLKQRVNDPNNPFLGYWDAQQWVFKQYGIAVKYQRIGEYMIQHFITNPKNLKSQSLIMQDFILQKKSRFQIIYISSKNSTI